MKKLLPCPFCGEPAFAMRTPANHLSHDVVACINPRCGVAPIIKVRASRSLVDPDGLEEALRCWNRRAPIESASGIAALADELEWQESKSRA